MFRRPEHSRNVGRKFPSRLCLGFACLTPRRNEWVLGRPALIPSSSCNSRLAVSKGHRNPYKYSTAARPLGRESRGSYNSFPHFFVPMFVAWA